MTRVKVTGDLFHGQVPDGAVYVGRAAPGLRRSPYANPYPVKTYGLAESLLRYRTYAETFDLAACGETSQARTSHAGAG